MTQSYFVPDPLPSGVVALALLGTAFVTAGLLVAAAGFLARGKRRLAARIAASGVAVPVVYLSVLLSFSLSSREGVLHKGDRKYFCEIDCHLAYSLEETAQAAGPHGSRTVAATIRTWFDEKTIASFRGNAPLTPNPRVVYALDNAGRRYEPSYVEKTPLTRMLRPGESYTTTFVFDLPETVHSPRLFLGDAFGPEIFLIGHENSLFHKKTYFEL